MKKYRKIYYVPGMISLILLPVLCIFYLDKHYYEECCIEIVVPEKYNPTRYTNTPKGLRFDTTLLSIPENRRIYTTFEFNGNDEINKIRLDSSTTLLKQIILTEDTINGVRFILGDSAKYSTFIEILDLCFTDSFPTFVPYENDVWWLYTKKSEEIKQRIREIKKEKERIRELPPIEKQSFTEKINAFFHDENIIKMKYFFVLFTVFSIISIFYTWRKFIKK